METISNYGQCYEPIQRIYRNAVVAEARRRLQGAFPDDWRNRLKATFKSTWQK